jgi:uncharacterized protein YvpB
MNNTTCCICNWTNDGLINIGEFGKPQYVCLGCIKRQFEERKTINHCADCCYAQSWKALGITEYTGKSIPELIQILQQRLIETQVQLKDVEYY